MTYPCARCDHDNPEAARYCSHCAAPRAGDLIQSATRMSPLMQKWRKLSTRLTRREARQLLGEPARIDLSDPADSSRDRSAPTIEAWTFEYEVVGGTGHRVTGQVRISVGEGRVLSWVEPDWNALAPVRTPSSKSTRSAFGGDGAEQDGS